MIDRAHCSGCYNDVYNGGLAAVCWSRKTAKMVTRFRIHRDSPPDRPRAFTEVEVPDCYRAPPMFFYHQLPDFVRAEDVVRRARRGEP